jgi:hypothetical protein
MTWFTGCVALNECLIAMRAYGKFSMASIERRFPIGHQNSQIFVNNEDKIPRGVKNTLE